MLEWIQDSPLYIAVDASQISFQTYETGISFIWKFYFNYDYLGIYSDINCSKTTVNHAVKFHLLFSHWI